VNETKPRISLFFPVYRDEHTVETVTRKAITVLSDVASEYEIIIIDDGSPDRSAEIAEGLAAHNEVIRVIRHGKNRGYGAAIKTGFANCQYEWICLTDGDDEYDVFDLYKLIRLRDFYDLIITFRYVKFYSGFRQFVSWIYNKVLRVLFKTPYRDISTGLRLVRKSLVDELDLQANSPFIGAELAIKTMLKGFRVGEVGIQTFPREFGKGASVTPANILATIRDMLWARRTIFSNEYELPLNRQPWRKRGAAKPPLEIVSAKFPDLTRIRVCSC
jgi:glycosyltransferase involved in cell wall biosynthesis